MDENQIGQNSSRVTVARVANPGLPKEGSTVDRLEQRVLELLGVRESGLTLKDFVRLHYSGPSPFDPAAFFKDSKYDEYRWYRVQTRSRRGHIVESGTTLNYAVTSQRQERLVLSRGFSVGGPRGASREMILCLNYDSQTAKWAGDGAMIFVSEKRGKKEGFNSIIVEFREGKPLEIKGLNDVSLEQGLARIQEDFELKSGFFSVPPPELLNNCLEGNDPISFKELDPRLRG
ncbi:MAG TPA: hypothetical protein VMW41_06720 [Candidatus Bathyarchaeia archaeon]|nr:hypothetical protein [Candidatus Bathyarchaeia archaeon]